MRTLKTSPQATAALPARETTVPGSRLLLRDVFRLGTTGLRARPTRAVLSALGIAIGIAAMIAVVGISSSSQARLNAELSRLGTNLLTATAGQGYGGEKSSLSADTVGKVKRIPGVNMASGTSTLTVPVYRSPLSDPAATGGLSVMVADTNLLEVVSGEVRMGSWFNRATDDRPTVVLGSRTAEQLGVVSVGTQVWLGGTHFTVTGILEPVALAPELDRAALIGAPIAQQLFDFGGSPGTVYERSAESAVEAVRSLLGPSINPEHPEEVKVSRPSDALAAQNAANQAFTGLLLGLGSIALLVGGIGVANTMIISVLERRKEIGLRRALGATRAHILVQFLAEALLLSLLGGVFGAALGLGATGVLASLNHWPFAMPPEAVVIGILATLAIGAVAGLYPAIRAARTPPTAALSS